MFNVTYNAIITTYKKEKPLDVTTVIFIYITT